MPIELLDGGGSGLRANVTEDSTKGRLDVSARIAERIYYANRNGDSYVVFSDITPTAANDVFLYIKNTSNNLTLILEWYCLWCATDEAFDFVVNQTGTLGGSPVALTPVNLNLASGKDAGEGFFEGADLTGLDAGDLVNRVRVRANVDNSGRIPGGIRISQNKVFTMQALTGGLPVEVTVGFNFE